MEEDGDGEDLTPFWVQSTNNFRRGERLRRGVAAVFFSSGLVVFILLVTAVIFLVFVMPSISFSANVFRPNSVKKSWDSLNIVLVLVAVVFGFLSRSVNEERDEFQPSNITNVKENHEAQKSNPSTPNKWLNNFETKSNLSTNQWYEFQDYNQSKMEQKNSILRRSSSSYPDLREFPSSSSANWNYGDYERRFFDDFHVDSSRSSDPSQLHHRRHRSLEQVDYLVSPPQTKTVIVDRVVSKSAEALKFPAALSSPAAAEAAEDEEIAKKVVNESEVVRKERSSRRFYKDMEILNPVAAPLPPVEESSPPEFQENQIRGRERGSRKKERLSRRQSRDMEVMNPIATPPSHAPPPPPTPPPPPPRPEQKSSKSERRRGGATGSSTKDFLNSLYNNKKKKKQRQRSVDNMDSLLHEAQPPLSFQIPPPSPPPPPPPLPPPSVFHTLFSSKKPKRKRTITVALEPLPASPPPAPPPPPRATAREPEPTSQAAPMPTHKPPKPVKMNKFDILDEASNSCGESPLNRIPPPQPPPPSFLKNPAWKFVVQGDYVRVNSNESSRSGSPDLDEVDSDVTPSASDGGDAAAFHPSPLFCASPDVNSKAENFIINFRAKLKLEKISSMKKRDVGPSSLGPGPGPIQN